MTPATQKRELHRMYFWLMDFSLLFVGVAVINWLASPYQGMDTPLWYRVFQSFIMIANGGVPLFLMFASFMRDDYAQGLWKRTLAVMGYATAMFVPAHFIASMVLYLATAPFGFGSPKFYVDYMETMRSELLAPEAIIWASWLTFMGMFIVIFQFLRWRDSR